MDIMSNFGLKDNLSDSTALNTGEKDDINKRPSNLQKDVHDPNTKIGRNSDPTCIHEQNQKYIITKVEIRL